MAQVGETGHGQLLHPPSAMAPADVYGAPTEEQLESEGPHMQCLRSLPRVNVKEQVSIIEAVTAIIGQEIEMANKYKIVDGDNNQQFFAAEETGCCTRQLKQCAPDCAPWSVGIAYTPPGGPEMKAFTLKRDWTCTCLCFNRPVVDVYDDATKQKLGSISDPFACCDLTFSIRDPSDNLVLKANGGCCQWGLCCPLPCGPCAEVNFPVTDAKTGDEVGHLKKKVPGCCKFCCAPDVDNFEIEFDKVGNPQYKALMMALALFMDFRYFSDNPNDDQEAPESW
uniref:Phospholipid scramblase n=1 Tax=Alexandrium monilatum TaxID=311494 RepID=A0A7S4QGY9_9DINO|mmetsp:Transcript_47072/g.147649  ORF Transcript_47072/g.147649 Transcript_47072/m.147649 type:complete len:281 (+) Transcript_47072:19-861(+)